MVAYVIQVAEHITLTDIVRVQAEVVVLIQKNMVVLLHHHVHVQLGKVHLMVVIVLVQHLLAQMENVNAQVVSNIQAVDVEQLQQIIVLQELQ